MESDGERDTNQYGRIDSRERREIGELVGMALKNCVDAATREDSRKNYRRLAGRGRRGFHPELWNKLVVIIQNKKIRPDARKVPSAGNDCTMENGS